MTWHVLLPVTGLSIISLGAYFAGGDMVSCAPKASAAAGVDCRVETRRLFGWWRVSLRDYHGITGVEAVAVAGDTSTTRNAGGRSRADNDTIYLRLMSHGSEVGRVQAMADQAEAAEKRVQAWLAAGATRPVSAWLSSWTFALIAMGFGAAWTLVTGFLSRLAAAQQAAEGR